LSPRWPLFYVRQGRATIRLYGQLLAAGGGWHAPFTQSDGGWQLWPTPQGCPSLAAGAHTPGDVLLEQVPSEPQSVAVSKLHACPVPTQVVWAQASPASFGTAAQYRSTPTKSHSALPAVVHDSPSCFARMQVPAEQ
jgi:hypothetical protein